MSLAEKIVPFFPEIRRQWPIILRGTLWVMIAVLTDVITNLHDLTTDNLVHMHWTKWTELALKSVLAGAIALRLFLDGSVARHQQNLAVEEHGANPLTKQTV